MTPDRGNDISKQRASVEGSTALGRGQPVPPHLVRFGDTDLYVSRYCQGTAFGKLGRSSNNLEGQRVMEYCLDVGVNFFDSSNGYGWGGSEVTLGKAVKRRRDEAVICTKVAPAEMPDAEDGEGEPALYTRELLLRQLEGALRRLDTDYIDIYMLHHPVKVTPYEEIVDTLDSMVRAGKIRYWGASNHTAAQVNEILEVCERDGSAAPAGLENCYNIANTPQGDDLFPTLSRTGLGFMTCRPHSAGKLLDNDESDAPGTPDGELMGALNQVSAEVGRPLTQVCIAWALSHPEITSVLTCSESPDHVLDNLAGTTLELPAEALSMLNAASAAYTEWKWVGSDYRNGCWLERDPPSP